MNPKRAEGRKIIRAESSNTENRKSVEGKINEMKNWFSEINQIDKPLARATKKKEKKDKLITNIRKVLGVSLQTLQMSKE